MTKVFLLRVPALDKDQLEAMNKIRISSHVDRSKVKISVFETPKGEFKGGKHYIIRHTSGAISTIWAKHKTDLLSHIKDHGIKYISYTELQ